ncbi:hypothetical protein [Plantibacter sp. M259]|uniref:phosphoribosyltransferase-like protein n=1 Tax=Plantibacter sp. M259 TaxID=2583822 RepID=UPI0011106A2E|nr:hypothetical protein [Plantibacter sp. M259]
MAGDILESFVHLNEEQIIQCVGSTIRSLSASERFGAISQRRAEWNDYLNRVVVSFPLSREGDPTASGYIFARIASEKLGFNENQVLLPEQLVRKLAGSTTPIDLIMLDDITASGTQFLRSWNRKVETPTGKFSLADLAQSGKLNSTYYLPIVATEIAKSSIESNCAVEVIATYLLTPDYCVLDAKTRLVRSERRGRVADFLSRHSPRTSHNQYGPAGYDDLGLAVSFHHGCPNNTIPLLQWDAKTTEWTPLIS